MVMDHLAEAIPRLTDQQSKTETTDLDFESEKSGQDWSETSW